jgi:hypothetical protein
VALCDYPRPPSARRSLRESARFVAAQQVGNLIIQCRVGDVVGQLFGPVGGRMIDGQFKNTRAERGRTRAREIDGRGTTLRKKLNVALKDPANQIWTTLVPAAVRLLSVASEQPEPKRLIPPFMFQVAPGVYYSQFNGKTAFETAIGMLKAAGETSASASIEADWHSIVPAPDFQGTF